MYLVAQDYSTRNITSRDSKYKLVQIIKACYFKINVCIFNNIPFLSLIMIKMVFKSIYN